MEGDTHDTVHSYHTRMKTLIFMSLQGSTSRMSSYHILLPLFSVSEGPQDGFHVTQSYTPLEFLEMNDNK